MSKIKPSLHMQLLRNFVLHVKRIVYSRMKHESIANFILTTLV